MRILSFFFSFVAIILGVSVFSYFIGASIWLFVGTMSFVRAVEKLPDMASQPQNYVRQCQNAPAASDSSVPLAFQVRFENDHTYVVELICSLVEDSPIELSRGSLFPFIRKLPGSSGIYYSLREEVPTTVELAVLNARRAYILEQKKVKNLSKRPDTAVNVIKNTCVGFGYQCCDKDSQIGNGDSAGSTITDCPANCFNSCKNTAYFSAFVSDPFPTEGRVIEMTEKSLTVTFSYTAEHSEALITAVDIEYGDGTTDTASQAVGVFNHTYTCESVCTYKASIKATDSDGNLSNVTENTVFTIIKK